MAVQYESLKNNLHGNKEVFTSKHTTPLYRRETMSKTDDERKRELSHEDIERHLRK